MKNFNNVIASAIAVFVLAFAVTNLFFYALYSQDTDDYQTEINRLSTTINEQGFSEDLDLEGYEYITSVTYLSTEANDQERMMFYTEDGVYQIRPYGTTTLDGYLKFSYAPSDDTSLTTAWIFTNILLAVAALLVFAFIFSTKNRLARSSRTISKLTQELSEEQSKVQAQDLVVAPLVADKDSQQQDDAKREEDKDSQQDSKSEESKDAKPQATLSEEDKDDSDKQSSGDPDSAQKAQEEYKAKELELAKEYLLRTQSISDGIKTPLASIRLYTKALDRGLYKNDDEKSTLITRINTKTDEIDTLVQEAVESAEEDTRA